MLTADQMAELMNRCTTKRRFNTEKGANITAEAIRQRSGDHLFSYQCGACGGYHLTSAQRPAGRRGRAAR